MDTDTILPMDAMENDANRQKRKKHERKSEQQQQNGKKKKRQKKDCDASSGVQCNVKLPKDWHSIMVPPSSSSSSTRGKCGMDDSLREERSGKSPAKGKMLSIRCPGGTASSRKQLQQGKKADRSESPAHQFKRAPPASMTAAAAEPSSSAMQGTLFATGPPHSTRDACESILAAIQRSQAAQGGPDDAGIEVNLDHILSKVPYKNMLKDLFGSNASATQNYRAPCIPVVSKAYEESYMRQPMYEYERPCVMGANCECNFIGTAAGEGFTAVEFLLPSEASALESRQLAAQQMCVLCHRRLVQSLFYDIIYTGSFPALFSS